jgi:HPt (histidine-containing phosphotransfer) domain-containing protein
MARMTAGPEDEGLQQAIRAVWMKYRALNRQRLETLLEARQAILQNALGPDLRARGALEAHRLSGAAGSFGYEEISTLCREVELVLESGSGGAELSQKIERIRCLLEPTLE